MDIFLKYKTELMEIDSGKRKILIIRTGKPGEQLMVTSDWLNSGRLSIQRMNKGTIKEEYIKNIEEIFKLSDK